MSGLTTDALAVELWLVCTERVRVAAGCVRAAFAAPDGARLAVGHTLAPAFNAPVADSFRFVLARAPGAPDATAATVATVSYGPARAPAVGGLVVRPSAATLAPATAAGAPRLPQHRRALTCCMQAATL